MLTWILMSSCISGTPILLQIWRILFRQSACIDFTTISTGNFDDFEKKDTFAFLSFFGIAPECIKTQYPATFLLKMYTAPQRERALFRGPWFLHTKTVLSEAPPGGGAGGGGGGGEGILFLSMAVNFPHRLPLDSSGKTKLPRHRHASMSIQQKQEVTSQLRRSTPGRFPIGRDSSTKLWLWLRRRLLADRRA